MNFYFSPNFGTSAKPPRRSEPGASAPREQGRESAQVGRPARQRPDRRRPGRPGRQAPAFFVAPSLKLMFRGGGAQEGPC